MVSFCFLSENPTNKKKFVTGKRSTTNSVFFGTFFSSPFEPTKFKNSIQIFLASQSSNQPQTLMLFRHGFVLLPQWNPTNKKEFETGKRSTTNSNFFGTFFSSPFEPVKTRIQFRFFWLANQAINHRRSSYSGMVSFCFLSGNATNKKKFVTGKRSTTNSVFFGTFFSSPFEPVKTIKKPKHTHPRVNVKLDDSNRQQNLRDINEPNQGSAERIGLCMTPGHSKK